MGPQQDHQRRPISTSSQAMTASSQASSYIPPSQLPSPPISETQTTAPSSFSSAATFASVYSQHMAPPLSSPTNDQIRAHHNQYTSNITQTNSSPHPPASRPHALCSEQNSQQQDRPYGSSTTIDQTQFYSASQRESSTNDQTATTPFLRDFNLVAEAAKRAQMAVLMRDMDGVSL